MDNLNEKNVAAVIDRFEGDFAVLYIGEDEQKVDVPRQQLPRGSKEGHHLKVTMQGHHIQSMEIDEDATENTRNRIQNKLDRLRRGEHITDS